MANCVGVAVQTPELREQIRALLAHAGITATVAAIAGKPVWPLSVNLLLLEYSPATWDLAEAAINHWRRQRGRLPVMLVVLNSNEDAAIRAVTLGIAEYLRFPAGMGILAEKVNKLLANYAGDSLKPVLIGASAAARATCEQIRKMARTDSNVLITGETGTGKEIVAQSIHAQSRREGKPLVCVNCAAIPDGLLESELFGYEKGAFTGAQSSSEGKIRLAEGGTLFLDEIGEMSPYAQAKILRVIDTREVWPLSAKRSTQVDVRIVAATNRDLNPFTRVHDFRSDLYFRLNATRIELAPLRERRGDIGLLVNHFITEFNSRFGLQMQGFSEEAMGALLQYSWPGNIRELRNLVESLYVNLTSNVAELADLPSGFKALVDKTPGERDRLVSALCDTDWNISSAAKALQWSRMTMYRKMVKHQLVRQVKFPLRTKAAAV